MFAESGELLREIYFFHSRKLARCSWPR
jgi:hypothetical protein